MAAVSSSQLRVSVRAPTPRSTFGPLVGPLAREDVEPWQSRRHCWVLDPAPHPDKPDGDNPITRTPMMSASAKATSKSYSTRLLACAARYEMPVLWAASRRAGAVP